MKQMVQRCYAAPYDAAPEINSSYSEDGRGSMRGGEILFSWNPDDAHTSDWLFVTDSPYDNFRTRIPRERRILFLSEPPVIEEYQKSYLDQFGILVSPYVPDGYEGFVIVQNPCLGWFVGRGAGGSRGNRTTIFDKIDDVINYRCMVKTKEISIVSSLKTLMPGHKKRVVLLDALRNRLGERMDFFGREFAPVEDKLYAIGPYKYHIAIENCSLENYWTEKLTDAWIAWSLPIYCGDPTIIDQVPDPLGIEVINAADTESSVRRIESILNEDIYESRYEAIKKCREWAIAESNPYEKVCRIIESSDGKTRHAPPESADYLVCGKASVRTTVIFDLIADTFGKNCSKNLFNGYKHLQRRLKK